MSTNIRHNGSQWQGDSPEPLENFMARLRTECLDPRFERYGNFVLPTGSDGFTRIWGNFFTVSALFDIQTNNHSLLREIVHAIRLNQDSGPYQLAKREMGVAA